MLEILSLVEIWFLSALRCAAFFLVGFLIISDLLSRFGKKNFILKRASEKQLTMTNYIGIAILIVFIIWPSVQEANFGNFSVKKLENKLVDIQNNIENLFNRKALEYWFYDDFAKFNVEQKEELYHYTIPLKYKPIKKSVELWLGQDLQNPMYYTVYEDEKKIIYRNSGNPETLKSMLSNQKPAMTVQYIVSN